MITGICGLLLIELSVDVCSWPVPTSWFKERIGVAGSRGSSGSATHRHNRPRAERGLERTGLMSMLNPTAQHMIRMKSCTWNADCNC